MSIETINKNLFFNKVGGLFVVELFVGCCAAFPTKQNGFKSAGNVC